MSLKHEWFDLVLSERKLSPTNKLILFCIWNHMNSSLTAYPSRDKIREITGCKLNTITQATKKAEEVGLLKLSYRRHNNSQHRHRVYAGILPKSKVP